MARNPLVAGASDQMQARSRRGGTETPRHPRRDATLRSLGEQRALRGAKMVQALDGAVAGGTQRDIASALYREKAVRAEWRGASVHLRLKVQRILRKGRFSPF